MAASLLCFFSTVQVMKAFPRISERHVRVYLVGDNGHLQVPADRHHVAAMLKGEGGPAGVGGVVHHYGGGLNLRKISSEHIEYDSLTVFLLISSVLT